MIHHFPVCMGYAGCSVIADVCWYRSGSASIWRSRETCEAENPSGTAVYLNNLPMPAHKIVHHIKRAYLHRCVLFYVIGCSMNMIAIRIISRRLSSKTQIVWNKPLGRFSVFILPNQCSGHIIPPYFLSLRKSYYVDFVPYPCLHWLSCSINFKL